MINMMDGPFWGIVAVVSFGGLITIGCFALMFKYIFCPGEKNKNHAKYDILRRDR